MSASDSIQERLKWAITPELYERIRRLWIKHSIAEDKRDLAGLIGTLSEDCVYEIMPTGQRREGHDGARLLHQFSRGFPVMWAASQGPDSCIPPEPAPLGDHPTATLLPQCR